MTLDTVLICAVLPVAAWAAWSDFRFLRIPNWTCLAAVAIFLAGTPFLPMHDVIARVIAGGAAFAILFGLFAFGIVGAGDVKLLAALILFVPTPSLQTYMYALAGTQAVALAAISLAQRMPRTEPSRHRSIAARGRFPMGIPISLALAIVAAIDIAG